jgi:two-component system NtrC family sensor kinase
LIIGLLFLPASLENSLPPLALLAFRGCFCYPEFKSFQVTLPILMAKILLVEDDVMISEIYQRKFVLAGFEVDVAMSGREVLQKVEQNTYDLILLDVVLPEMNGMDVLAELRKSHGPDLKIIIFSNLNEQEDRKKAFELGANGYIPKTEYSPSRLVEEVQRFLYQFDEQKKNLDRSRQASAQEGGVVMQTPAAPQGKHILLIEDERVFFDMFGKRLEDEGYRVVYAFDGASGLKMALNQPFDLIITDMVLPGMSGQEVLENLKQDESVKDVPVFLFSASVEDEKLEQLQCEGADRCFKKTRITPSELTKEVNALFSQGSVSSV